jgi:hypothetical protein
VAAVVFGFFLYWAMQPIVISNQGTPNLSLRRPAAVILRGDMADTLQADQMSVHAAQQENRLLDVAPSPIVGAVETKSTNAKSASQRNLRRRPAQHTRFQQAPSWASRNPHDMGFWFR